jgi:hypothetical protein
MDRLGLLSSARPKIWPSSDAVDIDPESVRVTRFNAWRTASPPACAPTRATEYRSPLLPATPPTT